MPFLIKELAITLASIEDGDHAWFAMIGCGPASAEGCNPGATQPPTKERKEPFDYLHGLKEIDDVRALKLALNQMLIKVAQLEEKMEKEA